MKMTAAAANKTVKMLSDRKNFLLRKEREASVYVLAEHEAEDRPAYDYVEMRDAIFEIEEKIRKIKHAVNVFNTTHRIPAPDITVDESLIRMAQLNDWKSKLDMMRCRLPKERINSGMGRTAIIEYEYTNYDHDTVEKDYDEICREIIAIQMGLDKLNQTIEFDVPIEQ